MVQINFAGREVKCKIVFYGPGGSGKTTNLEFIHRRVPETARGHLTSIATDQDRTLFFDFMPLDLGTVAGMKTKLLLYTVPGQVYYAGTRKLVLQGADGVVFVADSDPGRMSDNLESLRDMAQNMKECGLDPAKTPVVIQFNKRDLPGAVGLAEMEAKLNMGGLASFEAVAVKGEGVMQTLKAISRAVIDKLNEDYAPGKVAPPAPPKAATPKPIPAVAPKSRTSPESDRVAPLAGGPGRSAGPGTRDQGRGTGSPAPAPAVPRVAALPKPVPPKPIPAPRVPTPAPIPAISKPLPPVPRPVTPISWQIPKARRRKSRAWIWIIFVVLLLGAAGAFFGLGPGKPWMQKVLRMK